VNRSSRLAPAWLRAHWFFLAAGVVIFADLTALKLEGWSAPRVLEAALLFDFAVIVPLLHLWCYRAKGKVAIFRTIGLAALAIWAVGHVVPAQHHHLLASLEWLRPIILVCLAVFEIKILIAFYKMIFASNKSTEEVAAKMASELDLPPWVARLLELEARFWRKLATLGRRLFGRRKDD
jgi:hypothetical protein